MTKAEPPPTPRFPCPHRDDVLLAVISVLAGLLLWFLGIYSTNNRHFFPAWAALVPLLVAGPMELVRRTAPRLGLGVGTAAVIADQFTVGNLGTVLVFTDLMLSLIHICV